MKAVLQLVIQGEDGRNIVKEIHRINRSSLTQNSLGLSLQESKAINSELQKCMIAEQVKSYLESARACSSCEKSRIVKGYCSLVYRTLFGKINIKSPRLVNCGCKEHQCGTFSPLTMVLKNRTSPELEYLESKWASLMSYGMTAKLLEDILPIEVDSSSVFKTARRVSERIESELDDEKSTFIDGCIKEWEELPTPGLPLTVGIDGGYVRARDDENRKAGCFEVIVGKSVHETNTSKRFGYVSTYDKKPKRRLHDMLVNQGLQLNQQITFLSDGAENLRNLQSHLSPQSEHILDWFHITMRITVLMNMVKSLRPRLRDVIEPMIEKVKWNLWHGNLFKSLKYFESISDEIEISSENKTDNELKFEKYFNEFETYVTNNRKLIVNYDERYKYGETVSTSFVESTVNELVSKRMVKKQQMRWTQKGAHLLLQIRVKTLNNELKNHFTKWYPGFSANSNKMVDDSTRVA